MKQACPEVNEGFDEAAGSRHNPVPMVSRRPRSPLQRRQLMGRRVGNVVFATIFATATVVWSVQILTVVWASAAPSAAGCAAGTASLESAVARARSVYLAHNGEEDERAALARFRTALDPEWREEKAVEAACRADEAAHQHLKDVVALRYAEEHAVRYESQGLAPLRRRLQGKQQSPSNELIR
jgi:hypothetical protein